MLTLKQSMRLSAILGKLGIQFQRMPDLKDARALELWGVDIVRQVVENAYKAEKEVYALVADLRGCTVKEAENIALSELIKDLVGEDGLKDFLSSITGSEAPE